MAYIEEADCFIDIKGAAHKYNMSLVVDSGRVWVLERNPWSDSGMDEGAMWYPVESTDYVPEIWEQLMSIAEQHELVLDHKRAYGSALAEGVL